MTGSGLKTSFVVRLRLACHVQWSQCSRLVCDGLLHTRGLALREG
jgi:hypothetical protein